MKYKICKLQDGNGKIYYQIKEKGWLFWRWVKVARGPLEKPYYAIISFETLDMTQSWLKDRITFVNSKKAKVLETIDV